MDIPQFTERIAKERNCTPELVRAIVTDGLATVHGSTVKQDFGPALVRSYWELRRRHVSLTAALKHSGEARARIAVGRLFELVRTL